MIDQKLSLEREKQYSFILSCINDTSVFLTKVKKNKVYSEEDIYDLTCMFESIYGIAFIYNDIMIQMLEVGKVFTISPETIMQEKLSRAFLHASYILSRYEAFKNLHEPAFHKWEEIKNYKWIDVHTEKFKPKYFDFTL